MTASPNLPSIGPRQRRVDPLHALIEVDGISLSLGHGDGFSRERVHQVEHCAREPELSGAQRRERSRRQRGGVEHQFLYAHAFADEIGGTIF